MNILQEDKLGMFYVVKGTCERFQPTWVTVAVFAATYNLWVAKFPLIEFNRDAQAMEIKGITTEKKMKRAIMIDKSLFLINRLTSYGNVVNNIELIDGIRYTASDIKKLRDIEVIGICNAILTRVTVNAAALVPYGVTPALITEYQATIAAYSASLAKPETAKSQTKTATENLGKLFEEAEELLTKRLDLDIELFKTSKPDFYSQYKMARIVKSSGSRTLAVKGYVVDAGTGEPLKDVEFTFVLDNKGLAKAASAASIKPTVKKSAIKGRFRIANLAEGTYTITVRKTGYKELVLTCTVVPGATTIIEVMLEKN